MLNLEAIVVVAVVLMMAVASVNLMMLSLAVGTETVEGGERWWSEAGFDDPATLEPVPTRANPLFSPTAIEGTGIQFTDFSVPKLWRSIISWHWDFGDGKTSEEKNPVHVFSDNGVYKVSLTVTDNTGYKSTASRIISVSNTIPSVEAGKSKTARKGQIVLFAGSFFDASGDTHSIEWDFGDGSTASGTLYPKHAYTSTGNYTVTLKVRDDEGAEGSDTLNVNVVSGSVSGGGGGGGGTVTSPTPALTDSTPPTALAGPDKSAETGSAVNFDGGSSYDDYGITYYAWDFDASNGVGEDALGATASHAYTFAGTYTATLTVRDAAGNTATDMLVVTVSDSAEEVVYLKAVKSAAGYRGENVGAEANIGEYFDLVIHSYEPGYSGIAEFVQAYPDVMVFHQTDMLAMHAPYERSWINFDEVNEVEERFTHATDPASFTFIPGNGTIEVFWEADERPGVEGYNLYRSGDGTNYAKLNPAVLTETTFTDSGLTNGQTYYYRVKSIREGEETGYSHEVTFSPTTAPPNLVLYSVSSTATPDDDTHNPAATQVVFNFEVKVRKAEGAAVSDARILADLDADWSFEAGEELALSTSDGETYTATHTYVLGEDEKSKGKGFAYAVQFTDNLEETFRLPLAEDENLTTHVNNRIKNPAGGYYLMDIGSQSWRDMLQTLASRVVSMYEAAGVSSFGGLFGDQANWSLRSGFDAVPKGYSEAEWQAGMRENIRQKQEAISPKKLFVNALATVPSSKNPTYYTGACSGALHEGFIYNLYGLYARAGGGWSKESWKQNMDNVIASAQPGQTIVLNAKPYFVEPSMDEQPRMLVTASYLIVRNDASYLNYSYSSEWIDHPYLPEWDAPLGEPTETHSTVEEYVFPGESEVFKREYQNGVAIVNASNEDKSLDLSAYAGYSRVAPTDELPKQEGGTYCLEEIPNPYTLPAVYGLILVNEEADC